jgi:sarcosine oxidase/L-pipecolate oxidase
MAAIVRSEDHFDYAIVGGGCFGASAALALIREWPDAGIVWFEGTHTHTASQDKSKIIRAAYEDEDYVAFVEKALEIWQTDPLYGEHYHQTGWIQVVGEGSHANTIKGPNDRMISVEEMKQMVGSQDKPKLEAGEELRFNENIGYADFDLAVEAVAKEASMLGVRREKKDVTRLIADGGVCRGVEAGDYSIVVKKETVVAAGPWTPGLLERSKVEFPSDFFTVSAVGVATMPLNEKEFDELKSMPILVTEGGAFNSMDPILFRLIHD